MRKVLNPLRFNASITSVSGKDRPMNTRLFTPPRTDNFCRVFLKAPLPSMGCTGWDFRWVLSTTQFFDHLQLGLAMGIQGLGDGHKVALV